MVIWEGYVEPFTAIGLLSENCRMGDYPQFISANTTLNLCLHIFNHEGRPIYWKVVYKLGSNTTLPTNTTPSPELVLEEWRGVLRHNMNSTFKISIRIEEMPANITRASLIFELWLYDIQKGSWTYSGRWVHLHVNIVR